MSIRLIQSYPFWFLLLCLAAGLVYSGILYFRNKRDEHSKYLLYLLASFRFVVVSFLAFLLLGPLLQISSRITQKPILVFAQDNSQSLMLSPDSVYYKSSYLEQKSQFLNKVSEKFDTRYYLFGESFRASETTDYTDRVTDFSPIFERVASLYSNRNVGALVISSDGVFNRGNNPIFVSQNLPYPVYCIALGDTTQRKDLILKRIVNNRITFRGNKFPVEVEIEARGLEGETSSLKITREGHIVHNEGFRISSENHFETKSIILEADKPGTYRYAVELAPVRGEISTVNNKADFFIEVIDSRQQVLLLGASPHPDIGALKMALENNDNFEVTTALIDDFSDNVQRFNLVVLHQLPTRQRAAQAIFRTLAQNKIPMLLITGAQTNFAVFNGLTLGVSITPRTNDFVEALPTRNNHFFLFNIEESTSLLLPQLPPLYTPFAKYEVAPGTSALFFQKIGAVVTEQPLFCFSEIEGQKVGVIAGEGLWRWRVHSFLANDTHEPFDDLVWRLVQYLSVKLDKSLFRITSKSIVAENEPVVFEAELYNPSFELVNEPDVNLVITSSDGVDYRFEMAKTNNAYRLNAGMLPPGDYTYEGQARFGTEIRQAQGRFSVVALNLEGLQLRANHNLLFQVADNSNGGLFQTGKWEELASELMQRDDIRPVIYLQKELHELINYPLILLFLLFLLTVEWFVRKFTGGY